MGRLVGYTSKLRVFNAPNMLGAAFAVALALAIGFSAPAEAAGPSVGMVTKVDNDGSVVTDGSAVTAKVGTVVHMADTIQTGADSRLEVTFRDGTKVTLGENASIVIDKYAFNPDEGVGEASLNVTEGAFRFVTGRMNQMSKKNITVKTSAAQIGVRGTNFWGGSLGQYGLYVFSGAIDVTAQGVTVAVPAGKGTFIPVGGAPGAATTFTAEQLAQILDTIKFGPSGGGGGQQQQYQPQEQQHQQQQQQQQGSQQQATGPSGPPAATYAVVPVVVGGVIIGAVVWSANSDDNDDKGGRKPASP